MQETSACNFNLKEGGGGNLSEQPHKDEVTGFLSESYQKVTRWTSDKYFEPILPSDTIFALTSRGITN
jgi:hypothetical protein